MSLVAVPNARYRQLTAAATLATEDQPKDSAEKTLVAVHATAAAANTVNHIILKTDLAELERLAGETESDDKKPPSGSTLESVVRGLDPADDKNWTSAGKPALAVIETLFGKQVTRAAVDQAAPGFDREAAKAAAQA